MRRVLIFVSLGVLILAFSGSAGGVTREFMDLYPESCCPNALDIEKVTVSDPAGNFSIDVRTPNYMNLTPDDRLDVYLNTDRNWGTGWFGADYALIIQQAPSNCGVYGWAGSNWSLVRGLGTCPFNRGTTFVFSRADVGNPPAFDFWVATYWPLPPNHTESDRAPNSGSWLFDYTPPDTTITSGPSGSTPNRNASFAFTSTEAGSTFGCSLDGAGFTGCASGASYANLGFGNHTFQVRATDSSGNTDPSPATRTWTVVDASPPTVVAQRGVCCKANGDATLEFQIGDDSGAAAATIGIYRSGSSTPANVCSFPSDRALPSNKVYPCKVPAKARGWLRICVQGRDAAGNSSTNSCKRLRFGRLTADATAGFAGAGNGALRITSFRVTGLGGGKASIRCRGCRLRGRSAAGAILRPGASIEVRVVKPRIRGTYIRFGNVRVNLRKSKACLPPGRPGPIVSCSRSS
jgi:hypothetical protein